ncbi:MAG: DUF4389 domain-containing protein [Gaiellaceae bacterium]
MDTGRIRVTSDEPLKRRRLAVLFRAVLFLPHAIALLFASAAALVALVLAWGAASVAGSVPARLHRFLATYARYIGRATAWFYLLSGRYPSGPQHPFELDVDDPVSQRRLLVFARPLLAIPALVLASALRVVLMLSSLAAWFAALALGRTTAGLQELGMFCLRYELETVGYLLLLTPRYPRLAPE